MRTIGRKAKAKMIPIGIVTSDARVPETATGPTRTRALGHIRAEDAVARAWVQVTLRDTLHWVDGERIARHARHIPEQHKADERVRERHV